MGLCRESAFVGTTITSIDTVIEGDQSDALKWATDNLPFTKRDGVDRTQVDGWGEVSPSDFASQWGQPHLGVLTKTMILHADGTTRLTAGNAQGSLDFRTQIPVHPIQKAARNPDLERDFDNISRSAFGIGLTLDRHAGALIPLRMGEPPVFEHTNGVPSLAYLDALAALPPLEVQGDGIKSFMGLTIQLVAGNHQVVLVDEPEAFLHPPQARLLGRLLAQRASGQQVFIATHSADIVQGALESNAPVTIIRVTRDAQMNHVAVLEHDAVAELWSDPLLRYSDVLTGLFHDAVVVCESDSDCRYYAAVRDHLFPEGTGIRRPQLLYTHCGGKARLPVVIKALESVKVPVLVVADFDILRVERDAQQTFSALGGDWKLLAAKRNVLDAALKSDVKPLRKTAVDDALRARLETSAEILTQQDIESLRTILKAETGWDKAKRSGLSAVPQGESYQAAELLIGELIDKGLFVVPVGELERFSPGIGGHGPNWVNEVLEQRAHESPSAEATAFVTAIERRSRLVGGLPAI